MTDAIKRKELNTARSLLMVCLLVGLCFTAARSLSLGGAPPGSADGEADLNSPIALVFTAACLERQKSDEGNSRCLLKPLPASLSRINASLFASCHLRFKLSPSNPVSRTTWTSQLITRGPPSAS
jgi:hypothetical protein